MRRWLRRYGEERIEHTMWKSQRSDCNSGTCGRGTGTVHMLCVATLSQGQQSPVILIADLESVTFSLKKKGPG